MVANGSVHPEADSFGSRGGQEESCCLSKDGYKDQEVLLHSAVRLALENYLKEEPSDNSLRHSFGHDLVSANPPVPLDRVATLMGHFKEDGSPNIAMIMNYTTPGVENLEAAVESISWT